MSPLKRGPSKIHGQGILAARDIPAGARITHEDMVDAHIGFNHSCAPNLSPVDLGEAKPHRLILVDVKEGEELVCDYGVHHAKPEPCLCPQCR